MKQSLEIKLGQKLAMTPQLQQAIRLLQLSVIDLRTEIQDALDSNPLLDTIDPEERPETEERAADGVEEDAAEATARDTDDVFEQGSAGEELREDYQWEDDGYVPITSTVSSGGDDWTGHEIDTRNSSPTTLRDHLDWQMRMTPLSAADRAIAEALIEAVNDDGYLTVSIQDIIDSLGDDLQAEPDEVEAVLHLIQHFDPVGVAARDLRECLSLQLQHLDDETPYRDTALQIAGNHLELIASRDLAKLRRLVRCKADELGGAINLIQSLNPRPGASISSEPPRYVIPDVVVRKVNGLWQAFLNDEALPRLGVNKYYQSLIRRGDNSADNQYLRDHLQEARWYIKSLQNRNETLLRVANEIIRRQQDFFDQGDAAMKPMVLADIAEVLDLHESTISRVTTHKYMQTPLGVFELKHFFSSHVSTDDGGTCSATAIRSYIRKIVDDEPADKPISDNRIAELLGERGIRVARRTVAKYRELMNIPPSNMRKSLIT